MNSFNYFLRRVDLDKLDGKFINALDKCSERYNSIKENYPQSLTWFKNFVISTLIMSVERMVELENEEGSRKIQDSLIDYYSDEIEERWNELQEFGIRESVIRILKEETEQDTKKSYVIFVSGIESAMSHQGQTSLFEKSYRGIYSVKSFNFKNKSGIQKFIDTNDVKSIVLFSAACKLANQLSFPSNKIYCIEPWNGNSSDAGRAYIYTNIPAQNMYIDVKSYGRGKGTKKGANETDHAAGHFKALTNSVSKIRF